MESQSDYQLLLNCVNELEYECVDMLTKVELINKKKQEQQLKIEFLKQTINRLTLQLKN